MERISIFNYEVFYLDYLEGNLSEEDTRMLKLFLEEHPECRLEEEEFVALQDEESLEYTGKHQLKQVDETGAIAMDNVEHFMIADSEGILPEEKVSELNAFIAENPALDATRKRFAAVYFEPDSAVYAGKSDLKQKRTLVLWPYVSGAAAAAVVVIVMLTNFGRFNVDELQFSVDNLMIDFSELSIADKNQDTDTPEQKDPIVDDRKPENGYTLSGGGPIVAQSTPRISDAVEGQPLKMRKANLPTMFDNLTLQPVTEYGAGDLATTDVPGEESPNLLSAVPSKQKEDVAMHNPIKPITNFISDKSNREVDFRQRKSTNSKKGGFYIKIGKFEVSRNKH